jgi:hypothetical protein
VEEEGEMNATVLTVLLVMLTGWVPTLSPQASQDVALTGVVVQDSVRLRDDVWGAKLESMRSGEVVAIEEVKADETGDLWYRVQAGDQSGWIYGEYLRPTVSSRSGRHDEPASSVAIKSAEPADRDAGAAEPAKAANGVRVGLQVGHWRNSEAAYPYNAQDGATWNGHKEAEINLAIAEGAATLLRERGYTVDLMPTVMPKQYQADVVVAIHADGGPSDRRGFFADHSAAGSSATKGEDRLVNLLNQEYAAATGLTHVYRGTEGTLYYYGYYNVREGVPMSLIETGFLTNAQDREVIVNRTDLAAQGIARAIERFVEER